MSHSELPTDRAWLALLNHREPGPNMLAIARVRNVRTALDATGMRMPDDDGVMRCVVCLQPATERQTAMVTGYELLCCGQEWRAERARMGAEGEG